MRRKIAKLEQRWMKAAKCLDKVTSLFSTEDFANALGLGNRWFGPDDTEFYGGRPRTYYCDISRQVREVSQGASGRTIAGCLLQQLKTKGLVTIHRKVGHRNLWRKTDARRSV